MQIDGATYVIDASCSAACGSNGHDPHPIISAQTDDLLVFAIKACLAAAPQADRQYRIGLATAAALLNCDRIERESSIISELPSLGLR